MKTNLKTTQTPSTDVTEMLCGMVSANTGYARR